MHAVVLFIHKVILGYLEYLFLNNNIIILPLSKNNQENKKDNKLFFPEANVFQHKPQWMEDSKYNKKLNHVDHLASTSTASAHAKWVAAWWSTRLSQLAAQAYAEHACVSFQDVLTEFLHANQMVAEEANPMVGWKYDHHVWNQLKARSDRGEKNIKVKTMLTEVSHNDKTGVEKTLEQSEPFPGKGKGSEPSDQGGKGAKGGGKSSGKGVDRGYVDPRQKSKAEWQKGSSWNRY